MLQTGSAGVEWPRYQDVIERAEAAEYALRIIAGREQCVNNLMSDKEVALAAIDAAEDTPEDRDTMRRDFERSVYQQEAAIDAAKEKK